MFQVLEVLGLSLPLALGIAAAPWAIFALMILLLTPRAIANAYAFMLGWYMGLLMVGILIISSPGLMTETGEPSRLMGWIRLGMAAVLLIFGLLLFRKLPRNREQRSIPAWIEKVDAFGFSQASITGFLLSTLNVKNSSMVVVGAAFIARQGLGFWQELLSLLLFCLIASIGILITYVIFILFRSDAERIFGRIKIWILKNRVLILLVIVLVFGAISLYKGIIILQAS
jgi:hypothetical protein